MYKLNFVTLDAGFKNDHEIDLYLFTYLFHVYVFFISGNIQLRLLSYLRYGAYYGDNI